MSDELNKPDWAKIGKTNRRKGAEFERRVRKSLEHDWTVARWNNNVDLDKKEFCQAKSTRFHRGTTGFPDFMIFTPTTRGHFMLKFVECKTNGKLDRIEKEKCQWMVNNGHNVLVAYNDEGKIKYKDFVDYRKPTKVCRRGFGSHA